MGRTLYSLNLPILLHSVWNGANRSTPVISRNGSNRRHLFHTHIFTSSRWCSLPNQSGAHAGRSAPRALCYETLPAVKRSKREPGCTLVPELGGRPRRWQTCGLSSFGARRVHAPNNQRGTILSHSVRQRWGLLVGPPPVRFWFRCSYCNCVAAAFF